MSKQFSTQQVKREAQNLKRALKELTISVGNALNALDQIMKTTADGERGQKVAKVCNFLEIANDRARYFALHIDYRTDRKPNREEMDSDNSSLEQPSALKWVPSKTTYGADG